MSPTFALITNSDPLLLTVNVPACTHSISISKYVSFPLLVMLISLGLLSDKTLILLIIIGL